MATMGSLHVVVQEAFLREILAAGHANKWPLPGMDSVVDIQVGLSSVGLRTDGADKWFLASMSPDVLLQAVVIITGFVTKWTHKVGRLGMGGQMRPKSRFPAKGFRTKPALERSLSRVSHQVGLQVVLVAEHLVAKVTGVHLARQVLFAQGATKNKLGQVWTSLDKWTSVCLT